MIEQAELTVAILGVVAGTCACALAEYNRRWKNYWAGEWRKAESNARKARADAWFHKCGALRARWTASELEDALRQIERQRSETTRKGNATRAAARKALIASTTAQLDREIAGKTDRMAA